jgi:hypothetical protein
MTLADQAGLKNLDQRTQKAAKPHKIQKRDCYAFTLIDTMIATRSSPFETHFPHANKLSKEDDDGESRRHTNKLRFLVPPFLFTDALKSFILLLQILTIHYKNNTKTQNDTYLY